MADSTEPAFERQKDGPVEFITGILQASTEYAVIGTDLDGTIVLWNEGACRLYGRVQADVLGTVSIGQLLPPAEVAAGRLRDMMREALRQSKWEGILTQVDRAGAEFPARLVLTPRRDAFGKPNGFLLISKDVTREASRAEETRDAQRRAREAARRAEDILRDTRERFTMLVDSVQDYAILMLEPDGRIASWNSGAQRLTGFSTQQMLGQHLRRLYVPEDVTAGRAEADLHLARSGGKCEHESLHLHADGSQRWTSMALTAINDAGGMQRGFAVVMRDMSEHKRFETEILRLNAELELRVRTRVRDLEAFSYSVSHDLRAPLRAINGFSQILVERHRAALPEQGQRFLDNILQASEQMGRMIDDLLDYARLGRSGVDMVPVDVGEVLAQVCKNLQARIEECGATISVQAPLPAVIANPTLLNAVFTNLIGNALTYRQPGRDPVIRVAQCPTPQPARSERAQATLMVEDNGIGIDPDYFEKIFTVFQRLHTDEQYPGTGIGLSIVQRSVGLMDGHVGLESQPGNGTRFFVTLRLAGETPDAPWRRVR